MELLKCKCQRYMIQQVGGWSQQFCGTMCILSLHVNWSVLPYELSISTKNSVYAFVIK